MRHRSVPSAWLFACLATLALTPAAADDTPLVYLQGLGDLRYHALDSGILDRRLHIYVRLPEEYAATGQPLPTVYLLDGGGTLPLAAGLTHYLRLGEEIPELLLVGISYGATRFRDGNMRQTDFTAPAADRDFWGGAATFQRVLAEELLPLVEGGYRSDPARRILFGHSLGGQFVLYTALTEPDLFFGLIASNPALHRNLDYFLAWQGAAPAPGLATRLFVSSGAEDDPRFREAALKWMMHWQGVDPRPWRLETRTLAGETHFSAVPDAFDQGLKWVFAGDD